MIAHGETFRDTMIAIDGSTFVNCTFEKCVLVYSGLLPACLDGNSFTACRWEFGGPAANTLNFMAALYRSGARDLVELTFQGIRKGAVAQARPSNAVVLN